MKPLILFVTALWLAGCGVVSQDTGNACSSDSTYPVSTVQTWLQYNYDLPFCWSATEQISPDGRTFLHLVRGDGLVVVDVYTQYDLTMAKNVGVREFGSTTYTVYQPPGEEELPVYDWQGNGGLFFVPTDIEHSGTAVILQNIYDYVSDYPSKEPTTAIQVYNDYSFSLPLTWQKQEIVPVEGARAYAHLVSSDGQTYVNLYASSSYEDFGSTRAEETLEGYFYPYMVFENNSETLLYSSTQGALLATNDLTNPEVQTIMNSLMLSPHEW